MENIKKDTAINVSKKDKSNEFIQLKEYKTPKLTRYGGISELVSAILFNGGDGGAVNFNASN